MWWMHTFVINSHSGIPDRVHGNGGGGYRDLSAHFVLHPKQTRHTNKARMRVALFPVLVFLLEFL
jgi:hypothetical protein